MYVLISLCMIVFLFGIDSQAEKGTLLVTETDQGSVKSITIPGGHVTALLPSGTLGRTRGFAFNKATYTIYVTDNVQHKILAFTSQDPGTLHDLVDMPEGFLYDMTVDTIRGHIYISDADRDVIYRVNEDGTGVTEWVSTRSVPYGITVAEQLGFLFWTETYHNRIMSAPLANATEKEIFVRGTHYPFGIHVDSKSHSIYWCERDVYQIESASLDGSNRRTIVVISGVDDLFFMCSFHGHLFVTTRNSSNSERPTYDIDINRKSYTFLETNEQIYAFGIIAIEDKAVCADDSCQNGGSCNNDISGFTCVCVEGFTGTTCETNMNDCASAPCENGATCQDDDNGYICACETGYTGEHCENGVTSQTTPPIKTATNTNTLSTSANTMTAANYNIQPPLSQLTIGLIVGGVVIIIVALIICVTVIIIVRNKKSKKDRGPPVVYEDIAGHPAVELGNISNIHQPIATGTPEHENDPSNEEATIHQYESTDTTRHHAYANTNLYSTPFENKGIDL